MIQKFPEFLKKKGSILKHLFKTPKRKQPLQHPNSGSKLHQQCLTNNKSSFKKPPSMYSKIQVDSEPGALIKFTFTPRSYLKTLSKNYVETLLMPPEIVNSELIWEAYNNFCSRIYEYDQTQGLFAESWERETDIYLWIKPYEEPTLERDINGVLQKRIRRPTRGVNRLRRRTLFLKWMLENSDWQEQLVLHYWNLPRKGDGGMIVLPWFTLEVEYKMDARKKLYRDHHWQDGTTGCTPQILSPSLGAKTEDRRSMPGALEFSAGDVPVDAEREGDIEADNRRYVFEVSQPLVEGTVICTATDRVDLAGDETLASHRNLSNASCEALLKSEECITSGSKIVPGNSALVRSEKFSVKLAKAKTPVSVTFATRIGEAKDRQATDRS